MKYYSTRGGEEQVDGASAVIRGLASDGGLYMPEQIPALSIPLEELAGMDYYTIAETVLAAYFPMFTKSEMEQAVKISYDGKFSVDNVVALEEKGGYHFLELFHGPTLAFKDVALSILPELMKMSLEEKGQKEQIAIIAATSGDTGKAAMAGFKNRDGFSILVYYPSGKVSRMQYLQMATEDGENCMVAAIEGNFDDTQTGIKQIFADRELAEELSGKGIRLSAANSINIGRLLPQIAYYVYGYGQLIKDGTIKAGDKVNVSVPTGNFGNILAAYFAKEMGLPLGKFICASNDNHVLYDFFQTGSYDKNRPLKVTTSPSMDILVSSNLERLLYLLSGRDGQVVEAWMKGLQTDGSYAVSEKVSEAAREEFYAYWADEAAVEKSIGAFYKETGYVMDPHTALAYLAAADYRENSGDKAPILVASTASPFKFSDTMCQALGLDTEGCETIFDVARTLAKKTGLPYPEQLILLENAPLRFTEEYPKDQMEAVARQFLGI